MYKFNTMQYGKKIACGRGRETLQPSVVLGSRPTLFFFILHNRGGGGVLTGLKHFWLTNSSLWLLLAVQNRLHM